ncbi:MAG: transcription elongation factor GreA [Bacteroidales bacterium]|jgi:transcription elongation factor GreA|nr:transcription elongation factor GreA [Bacteroidales bacterium]
MATDMTQVTYYTKDGFEKLKVELEHLVHIERPLISQQIAEARDKGDLSENAEYDAAKNAQGMLEMRISKLQDLIRSARLIDESKMDASKVQILSTVRIRNLSNNTEMTYTLVPENEANLKVGKLSVSSPIAKGLLGKSKGSKAEIVIPSGSINFEIVEIITK